MSELKELKCCHCEKTLRGVWVDCIDESACDYINLYCSECRDEILRGDTASHEV